MARNMYLKFITESYGAQLYNVFKNQFSHYLLAYFPSFVWTSVSRERSGNESLGDNSRKIDNAGLMNRPNTYSE